MACCQGSTKNTSGREFSIDQYQVVLSAGICGFENIGGDIDKVTGKRVTFAAFPWRWKKGDGCIVRLVAITDPTGKFRIETGSSE